MRPFKHPSPDEFSLERLFHALSDPVRLDIVRYLAQVTEATCGELDGGRPKSSMSHHFRVLRDAGLVYTRNAGTTHMNHLRREDLDRRFPGLLDAILAQSPLAERALDVRSAGLGQAATPPLPSDSH